MGKEEKINEEEVFQTADVDELLAEVEKVADEMKQIVGGEGESNSSEEEVKKEEAVEEKNEEREENDKKVGEGEKGQVAEVNGGGEEGVKSRSDKEEIDAILALAEKEINGVESEVSVQDDIDEVLEEVSQEEIEKIVKGEEGVGDGDSSDGSGSVDEVGKKDSTEGEVNKEAAEGTDEREKRVGGVEVSEESGESESEEAEKLRDDEVSGDESVGSVDKDTAQDGEVKVGKTDRTEKEAENEIDNLISKIESGEGKESDSEEKISLEVVSIPKVVRMFLVLLIAMDKPFFWIPVQIKEIIGWIGLGTVLLALTLWMVILFSL